MNNLTYTRVLPFTRDTLALLPWLSALWTFTLFSIHLPGIYLVCFASYPVGRVPSLFFYIIILINGKSLSWMGLTRERWCCTRGMVSRLDMEHMSDEYKNRYIIITLLKTPPWYYTDNIRDTSGSHRTEQEGGKLIRHNKGSPKYVVDRLLKLP